MTTEEELKKEVLEILKDIIYNSTSINTPNQYADKIISICKSSQRKEDIEWLEKLIKGINLEIEVARKANTNNGNQSILIFNMILLQLNKRLKELKQQLQEKKCI